VKFDPTDSILKIMTRLLVSLASLCCILTSALFAQEKSSTTLEIRTLAFTPDLQQKSAFAHDPTAADSAVAIPTPIKSYLNHEFAAVPLTARKIVFTTKPDRSSLNTPADIIGEATIPDGVKSAILIFLPANPGSTQRCQIMAIQDSKQAFPSGSIHITNLSPHPIRLILEKKNFDFKAGQTQIIQDPPVREGDMTGMRTFVFRDNAWSPVSTGLWPHPGKARCVKILFQNPSSGSIQLRAFDDVPPR
jgi:hypothetical protein